MENKTANFKTLQEGLEAASSAEDAGEFDKAIGIYLLLIEKHPHHEKAYRRAMMLYRKKKDLKKELTFIRQAIKTFESWHKETTRVSHGKKISTLSKSLSKAAGLLDKKGNTLYAPEPVAGWLKRLALVEQKIERRN